MNFDELVVEGAHIIRPESFESVFDRGGFVQTYPVLEAPDIVKSMRGNQPVILCQAQEFQDFGFSGFQFVFRSVKGEPVPFWFSGFEFFFGVGEAEEQFKTGTRAVRNPVAEGVIGGDDQFSVSAGGEAEVEGILLVAAEG